MKSLVIKLSSALVMQENHTAWMHGFAQLVQNLQAEGYKVCMVTSGAVALGRQVYRETLPENNQLYGILGQPLLFGLYSDALQKNDVMAAQMLITKDDFRSRHHYLKIRDALDELLHQNVVPLINENDAVRFGEKSFSDNDEIAGLVASLLGSERLIIASTVEGLLDTNNELVEHVGFGDISWRTHIRKEKSLHGKGGMELKCAAAELSARRGISTIICSGLDLKALHRAVKGEKVGTHFAADRHLSAKKRWLLDHATFAHASAQVDKKAAEIMKSSEASSLLLVGVTELHGAFERGDVIAIKDPSGQTIGYGQTKISSQEAGELMDHKQAKNILIHYDQYMGTTS